MLAQPLPSTMSSSNSNNENPSHRQERETLDLLTRVLLMQAATSNPQNLEPSRETNLTLLRQLELALGIASQRTEDASRVTQSSLSGSILQPLQVQLILDSLLRSGAPVLPTTQPSIPHATSGTTLGLPTASLQTALSALLIAKQAQAQAQPPLDVGLQQLAHILRQQQQASSTIQTSLPSPGPAMPVNAAALLAAFNALSVLQAQQAALPSVASVPPPIVPFPGLGVAPIVALAASGIRPIVGAPQQPFAAASSFGEPQERRERSVSTSADPSKKSRRDKKQPIKNEAFPVKLYRLLKESEEAGNDDVISFTHTGNAFKIHNQQRFANEILPDYFRHKRFDSFKRQLSMYGFVRIPVGPEEGSFEHRLFKRDRLDLLYQMRRVAVEQGSNHASSVVTGGQPPPQGSADAAEADKNFHVPSNRSDAATSPTASSSDAVKPPPSGA